ncbi:N-acetyltransferase family protein [Escherichia coli]
MAFVAVRRIDRTEERSSASRVRFPILITSMPEFAVLVRSDLKGLGLGRRLMEKLITYTRDHGLQRLNGITMPNNRGMVALARRLGLTLISSSKRGSLGLR